MKYGNIGKGIAFASLWYYAATIYPSLEEWGHGFLIAGIMVGMSFAVMSRFDGKPDKKEKNTE